MDLIRQILLHFNVSNLGSVTDQEALNYIKNVHPKMKGGFWSRENKACVCGPKREERKMHVLEIKGSTEKQPGQAIYTRFQSLEGHVQKMAYRCSKFNACCWLSCRDNSTMNCCIFRPTMTLHQCQGHRNEHEQICHASKSAVMPSSDAIV